MWYGGILIGVWNVKLGRYKHISYYIKFGSSKLLINMIATHDNHIFKIVTYVNLSHN